MFFNAEGSLYYELFSGWMGKGDKEAFAHALAATHTPYSLITTPVGSIGISGLVGPLRHRCHSLFARTALLSHPGIPSGESMIIERTSWRVV